MQQTTVTFGRRGAPSAPTTTSKTWAVAGQPARGGGAPPDQPYVPLSEALNNRGLWWLLTSYEGRIRRRDFWLARIGLTLADLAYIVVVVMYRLQHLGARPADGGALLTALAIDLIFFAIGLAFLWAFFAVDTKRCHDRGKSGWFSLLFLMPFVNLWPFVELGFLDGTPGSNRYGASPKGPTVDAQVFS